MKVKVYSQDGAEKGEMALPEKIFGCEVKEKNLQHVISAYSSNKRQGTSKTKTRSEVSGGGVKPFRQKGTGRARAGSNTSPLWVRGGKIFGAAPRDYTVKISPKMKKTALFSALSDRAKENKIIVLDKLECTDKKTKNINSVLKSISVEGKKNLLIVLPGSENIYYSGRNIKNLRIMPLSEINAYHIIKAENILFAGKEIVEKMEKELVS